MAPAHTDILTSENLRLIGSLQPIFTELCSEAPKKRQMQVLALCASNLCQFIRLVFGKGLYLLDIVVSKFLHAV